MKVADGIRFVNQVIFDRVIWVGAVPRVLEKGKGQYKRENQKDGSIRRSWPNLADFEGGGRGP